MFFAIVRKEFLSNLFSLRFTITIILCLLLMLISSYTLRERYERQLDEYNAAVVTHRRSLEQASSVLELMSMAYKLDKRPAVLSILAAGLEGIGRNTTINISAEPSFENSEMSAEPLVGLFGTLDFAFITRVVISLLALLFTYDAIAGEREHGTLKLMLSNAIPRDLVILGKALGSYLSILLPFMVSVFICLIVIILSPRVYFDGETWQRVLIAILVSLLYVWVFTAIGLFITVRTHRSATALLSLLLVWVFFVFAVPKASNLLAGQLYRIPSVQEIQAQKAAIEHQITTEFVQKIMKSEYMREVQEQAEELVKQWRAKGMSDEEIMKEIQAFAQKRIAEMQKEMQDRINSERSKIQTTYERKLRRQQEIAMYLSRISPASSYILTMVSLANTGIERQQAFLRDARQYQQDYADYLSVKLSKAKDLTVVVRPGEKVDLSDMPQFQPKDPALSISLSEMWMDTLLMFAMGALFFMAAYISFLRHEV